MNLLLIRKIIKILIKLLPVFDLIFASAVVLPMNGTVQNNTVAQAIVHTI